MGDQNQAATSTPWTTTLAADPAPTEGQVFKYTVVVNGTQCQAYDGGRLDQGQTIPGGPIAAESKACPKAIIDSLLTASPAGVTPAPAPPAESQPSTPAQITGTTHGNATITGSTAAQSPTDTTSPKKHGVSGGAVAGAAIGGLLAGALIACLVCFFLYRRQNKRRPGTLAQSHMPYDNEHKTGATVTTTAAGPVSSSLDKFLPQPVDDDTITKELSKIRDNIKNHVQAYYHFQPVLTDIDRSRLSGLATATKMSTSSLAGMLYDSSTRGDAVRLFIAWSILSRCESGTQQSLLPEGVAPLQDAIPAKGGNDPAKSALFSKWKVLTGALLAPQYDSKAHSSTARTEARGNIIADMDLVLDQLIQGGIDVEKRRRNLEMILSRAARLAFLLFSQPGSFKFDYSGGQRSRLVLFPGLTQVVGDQAQVLSPPRVLLHMEFATDATAS